MVESGCSSVAKCKCSILFSTVEERCRIREVITAAADLVDEVKRGERESALAKRVGVSQFQGLRLVLSSTSIVKSGILFRALPGLLAHREGQQPQPTLRTPFRRALFAEVRAAGLKGCRAIRFQAQTNGCSLCPCSACSATHPVADLLPDQPALLLSISSASLVSLQLLAPVKRLHVALHLNSCSGPINSTRTVSLPRGPSNEESMVRGQSSSCWTSYARSTRSRSTSTSRESTQYR